MRLPRKPFAFIPSTDCLIDRNALGNANFAVEGGIFMSKYTETLWTKETVGACEARFAERLREIAEMLAARKSLRVCTLTGPTCSGKTTAAKMLVSELARYGKRMHVISIDDFYYPTDYLQQISKEKGFDGIDYDSVDTIDLGMLRVFCEEIFTSSVVHCPIFDFECGRRTGYRELSIDENDVFLFEGIQASYPEVTALLDAHGSVSLYIAPHTPIETKDHTFTPNEIRLLRRIVRDENFRATSAEFTMGMWESVRRNEEANIFPYITEKHVAIDSTMPYELGMLRPFLERTLTAVSPESPHRSEADRILSSMQSIPPLPSAWIEDGFLYNEFI